MVKFKLIKRIIILILLVIMLLPPSFTNITMAFGGELPIVSLDPPPQTPSDPPSDNGEGTSSYETLPPREEDVYIDIYTAIEGNIWEDYNNIEMFDDDTGKSLGYIGNEEKDSNEPYIKNIDVNCFKEDTDTVVSTMRTTNNGYYKFGIPGETTGTFQPVSEGTYSIGINYGNNSLKYNGQDYSSYIIGKETKSFETKPVFEGKGFAQIYICIDFSKSMYNEKTIDNKRRIDVIAEAAMDLLDQLFEQDNVIIGIIGFSGQATILKRLDNDIAVLKRIIKEYVDKADPKKTGSSHSMFDKVVVDDRGNISRDSKIGTNISAAVTKAVDEGFLPVDESTKGIILFTDGASTTHNDHEQLYNNATEAEYMTIADLTNQDLRKVKNEGISLICVMTELDEKATGTELENKVIKRTFRDLDENLRIIKDDSKVISEFVGNEIKAFFKEILLDEGYVYIGVEAYRRSADNEERRAEVNNNFEELSYGKLEDFINIDNDKWPENAGEFVNRTQMRSNQSNTYTLQKLPEEGYDYWYTDTWSETSGTHTTYYSQEVHAFVYYVPATYKVDFYLARRQEFELQLKEYVTGIRITLSDKTVLHEKILKPNQLTNIGEPDMPLYVFVMDEILMHGATIEIEYTIDIRNTSNITAAHYSIVSYLDDANLVYNPDTKLLTEPNKTNKEYGWEREYSWQMVGIDKLKDEHFLKDDLVFENKECLNTNIYEELRPDASKKLKLVLSMVLDNGSDIKFNYINHSEIVNYSNVDIYGNVFGRRMEKIGEITEAEVPEYNHMYAGNKGIEMPVENDEDMSMVVQIMLPTGK